MRYIHKYPPSNEALRGIEGMKKERANTCAGREFHLSNMQKKKIATKLFSSRWNTASCKTATSEATTRAFE